MYIYKSTPQTNQALCNMTKVCVNGATFRLQCIIFKWTRLCHFSISKPDICLKHSKLKLQNNRALVYTHLILSWKYSSVLNIIDDNGTSCRKKRSEKSIVSFHKSLRACVDAEDGQFTLTLQNRLINLVINTSVFNDKWPVFFLHYISNVWNVENTPEIWLWSDLFVCAVEKSYFILKTVLLLYNESRDDKMCSNNGKLCRE